MVYSWAVLLYRIVVRFIWITYLITYWSKLPYCGQSLSPCVGEIHLGFIGIGLLPLPTGQNYMLATDWLIMSHCDQIYLDYSTHSLPTGQKTITCDHTLPCTSQMLIWIIQGLFCLKLAARLAHTVIRVAYVVTIFSLPWVGKKLSGLLEFVIPTYWSKLYTCHFCSSHWT